MLKEANIFNKEWLINDLVYELDLENRKTQIKNWFLKNYVKWYESPDGDNEKWITKHEYKEGEPEWAKKDGVYDYESLGSAVDNLYHIIDYFESLDERELAKIDRQPYSVIKQKVEEWDRQLASNMSKNQNKSKEGVDIKTIYKFKDGYSFVKLLSKEEYKKEGDMMGHCVGGYHGRNGITIYSLRDPKGNSHATLEVRNKKDINQIKGKQNDAPVEKYIPYIKEFIIKNNFDVLADGGNIGMLEWENEYYFEDSKKWLKVYKEKVIPQQDFIFTKIKHKIENGIHKGSIKLMSLYLKELPEFLNGIIINGGFNCEFNLLTSLKNSPKECDYFSCSHNRLTTLEGGPKIVHNQYSCHNNKLTNLKGSPKVINGEFYCYGNELTTLEGSPKTINGNFYCSHNRLTTLEDGPKIVTGSFYCNNNLVKLEKPKNTIIKGRFESDDY